jgi:hypothetical protein
MIMLLGAREAQRQSTPTQAAAGSYGCVASSAGMNGAATRRTAATSPVANEPATIQPMLPLDPGPGWDGWSRPVSLGVRWVVTMDSIPGTVRRRTLGTCRQLDTRRRSLILMAELAGRPVRR